MSDLAAAKAQLAFAELTGGVRFSGRKHGRDMAVFNRGKKSQQSGVGGGGGAVGTRDDDDARVRAAGASGSGRARAASTKSKSKRSKNAKASDGKDAADWNELGGGQDTSSDGEGDIDVFGGSASKKSDDATGEKGEKRRHKSALQEAADDATGDKGPRSALEEAANVLRKRHKIRVAGAVNSCPPPLESFDDLRTKHGLGRKMLERLVEAGFETPTPIQRQAIPILLEGSELLAVAPTGSGKTLAFLLPMVTRLRGKDDAAGGPRALLLSPTKELAQQSFRILKLLCRGTNSLRCVQGICSHASPTSFVFLGASLRLRCAIGGDATFGWWRD